MQNRFAPFRFVRSVRRPQRVRHDRLVHSSSSFWSIFLVFVVFCCFLPTIVLLIKTVRKTRPKVHRNPRLDLAERERERERKLESCVSERERERERTTKRIRPRGRAEKENDARPPSRETDGLFFVAPPLLLETRITTPRSPARARSLAKSFSCF